MSSANRSPLMAQNFFTHALTCWNWKCALLSATARSIIYLLAMLRNGHHGVLSILLVEMAYVTLTAGLYAGMQQKALGLRNRLLGNAIVVLGVPGLAQLMDWLIHRNAGAPIPSKTLLPVCIFTLVSALFHLYVMRRGTFLTNRRSLSLFDDFRRTPRLIAGFIAAPVVILLALATRMNHETESEAAF
jgi:hypothetical protein